MGASQSARKLTIANEEDDVNVIRISDAVAHRLAQSASEAPQGAAPTPASPVRDTVTSHAVPTKTVGHSDIGDAFYPPFTISALEVKQKMEKELSEQEEYWKRRMMNLEKKHESINRVLDEEYKKALTIFDDSRVIKAQDMVKPCNVNEEKVLKCYQENPRETLRCSDLVQQFSNCIDQRRAHLMKCN